MQDPTSQREEFDYGISRYWIEDGRICVIETQGDMRREAIDTWANAAVSLLEIWPADRPYALLHKLDSPGQGFTPYSRKRAQDIMAALPGDRVAYTAIVLADTFVNRVIGFFLRSVRHTGKEQKERVFVDMDDARHWLLDQLRQHNI
ncbi:MAG: hypothetical protein ACOCXR_01625 [Phototrophicaceae bacterium]